MGSQPTLSIVPSGKKTVRLCAVATTDAETHLTQHAAQVVVLLDEQVVQGLDASPPVQDETCASSGRTASADALRDLHDIRLFVTYVPGGRVMHPSRDSS